MNRSNNEERFVRATQALDWEREKASRTTGTREWWRLTADRFIGWTQDTAFRLAAIEFCADYCARQTAEGKATSVLHALAVFNVSTRCYCAECEKEQAR